MNWLNKFVKNLESRFDGWASRDKPYPWSAEKIVMLFVLSKGLSYVLLLGGLFFVGVAITAPIPHETLQNISLTMSNKLIMPMENIMLSGQHVGEKLGSYRTMIALFSSTTLTYIPYLILLLLIYNPINYYTHKLYWYYRRDRFNKKVEIYK